MSLTQPDSDILSKRLLGHTSFSADDFVLTWLNRINTVNKLGSLDDDPVLALTA